MRMEPTEQSPSRTVTGAAGVSEVGGAHWMSQHSGTAAEDKEERFSGDGSVSIEVLLSPLFARYPAS